MRASIVLPSALLIIFSLCLWASSQSGGTYDLSHNVVSGGGARSTGSTFEVTGTVGQPQAGTISSGASFDVHGGFWAADAFAPTAAPVTISGRVRLSGGTSMSRVRITLIELDNGTIRQARPNPLGYYEFDDVEIGTYIIRAQGGNYQFTPSEIFVNLLDNFFNADFEGVTM